MFNPAFWGHSITRFRRSLAALAVGVGIVGAAPAGALQAQDTAGVLRLPSVHLVDSLGARDLRCNGSARALRFCPNPYDRTYVRPYVLQLPPSGDSVTVTVTSRAFDVMLTVLADSISSRATLLLANDDGAGACDARIRHLFEPGQVVVVGQQHFESGAFTIDISTIDEVRSRGPCDQIVLREDSLEQPRSIQPIPVPGLDTLSLGGDTIVYGWLTRFDHILGDSTLAQAWPLTVRSIDSTFITLGSSAFKPVLDVVGPVSYHVVPDTLCFVKLGEELPAGDYRIVVSTQLPDRDGPFVLAVSPAPRSSLECPISNVTEADLIAFWPPTDPAGLVSRDTLVLVPGPDTKTNPTGGRQTDAIILTGPVGKVATVVVADTFGFAPRIFVSDGVNSVRQDHESGPQCGAQLSFTFPARGLVRLDVSSHGATLRDRPPPTGYSIRVTPSELRAPDDVCVHPGEDAADRSLVTSLVTDVVPESLESGTATIPIAVSRDSSYTIDVRSRDFDPYALLMSRDSSFLQIDDDSGPWCNARIMVEAAPADTLILVVEDALGQTPTRDSTREGRFTVHVRQRTAQVQEPTARDPVPGCQAPKMSTVIAGVPADATDSISIGDPASNSFLSELDALLTDSTYAARWRVDLPSDTVGVVISVESEEFDPYLWVIGSDFVLGDDDSGLGCNAAITLRAADSLDIVVNTFTPRVTGPYTLRVFSGETIEGSPCTDVAERYYRYDRVPIDSIMAADSATGVLTWNATGVLTLNDVRLDEDSTLAQGWRFDVDTAAGGQTFMFDLESDDFNAWLIVVGPDRVEEDDDSGVGTNARVIYRNATAGMYRLVVNSWGRNGTGAFTIRVRRAGAGRE